MIYYLIDGSLRAQRLGFWTMIEVTLFNDAACPWGYSANPAFRALEWRYGSQLQWRLVMIGLRDSITAEAQRSFDPAGSARRYTTYRDRYGMPFAEIPKARAAATGRGCRAVVAARLLQRGSEWRVFRQLQFGQFTTSLLLDDDEGIRQALHALPGLDADAIVDSLDSPEVTAAYERDLAEARTAGGTAIERQGKSAVSDGLVRYTAPSLIFEHDGRRLVAGGWQPDLAYDVLIANLDETIERTLPPDAPEPVLEYFPGGLATAEVAAVLAQGPDYVIDRAAAERALVELVAQGKAVRVGLGSDALWLAAPRADPRRDVLTGSTASAAGA
jgi:predicted DsbA family dithiol-disulfide isomerase